MKIAVQGFCIRDELNENFEGTFRDLRDKGFGAYEMGMYFGGDDPRVAAEVSRVAEYFGRMPGCIWSPEEAERKLPFIRSLGLAVESCHIFFGTAYESVLTDNLEKMIDFAAKNGITQYVIGFALASRDAAEPFMDQLGKAARALEAAGIHFAYHNHDKEMAAAGDRTVLEKILDRVPELSLQPDIGWMQAGNGPVGRILTNYSDRIRSIHFKDLLIGEESEKGEIVCTPIGSGDVDSLVAAPLMDKMPLMETGLIIDQDNARTVMLDELKLGLDYITDNFL